MNGVNNGGGRREDEQDGMSVHSPCKAPLSSASSLRKEQSQVEVELRLLEALEIYPLVKLRGVHRHFVLFGLTEYLRRSLNRQFSGSDVLQLLDRFYNLEIAPWARHICCDLKYVTEEFLEPIKPDDEETEILNQEEEFCLPSSYFIKEES